MTNSRGFWRLMALAALPALGLATLSGCGGCGTPSGGGGGGGGGGSVTPPNCDPNEPIPDDVTLEVIATRGDAVPGIDGATFVFFGTPIIDDVGRIAFWASYTGAAEGDAGLFVWDGTDILAIITDDPNATGTVPGREDTEFFGDMNIAVDTGEFPMAWGSDGRLIFVAKIAGEGQSRGIFRWRASDGDMIRVVDSQQQAEEYEDTTVNAFNSEFLSVGVSDEGDVPYVNEYTYITEDNAFVLGRRAVFTSDGSDQTRIADANPNEDIVTRPPDRDSSATFTGFGDYLTLNGEGSVLFQGQYNTTATSGGTRGVYARVGSRTVRVIDNRTNPSWPGLATGAIVNRRGGEFEGLTIGADTRIAIDTTVTLGNSTRASVIYWDTAEWQEIVGSGNYASALLSGMTDCGAIVVLLGSRPHLFGGGDIVDLAAVAPSAVRNDATWLSFGGSVNNDGRALLRYRRKTEDWPGLAFYTGSETLIVVDELAGMLNEVVDIRTVERTELDRPGRTGSLNDNDWFTFRVSQTGADDEVGTDDDVQTIFLGRAE